MNWNYLLIAVLAVFAFCIIQGYRKGFLRIVVSLIGTVAIIGTVLIVSPYVSDFVINNTGIYDKVRSAMVEVFKEDNSKLDNSIPENQKLTIESYSLPDVLKGALIRNNTEDVYKSLLVSVFEDYISGYLARLILKAGSFVGIFLLLQILLWLALKSVDIISKIPIIKGFNRFLGVVAGTTEALLIVWVFYLVIVIFIGKATGTLLMEEVYKSKFLTFLFNENYLMKLIT